MVLSPAGRHEGIIRLGEIRIHDRGWLWTHLRLRLVFDGPVEVDLDEEVKSWLPRRGNQLFSAFGAGWFGVITLRRVGFLFPRDEYHLVTFSAVGQAPQDGPVTSSRDGGELVGHLRLHRAEASRPQ